MDRRAFAKLAAGASLAAALPEFARGATTTASAKGFSAIDVHCHLFNATDLPICGFITDCCLNDLPAPLREVASGVIWLIVKMAIMPGTMSAADEARLIRTGSDALSAEDTEPIDELVKARVRAAVTAFRGQGHFGLSTDAAFIEQRTAHALSRFGLQMPSQAERSAVLREIASAANPSLAAAPESAITPEAVAQGAVAQHASLRGIFRLAALVTRRRLALTQELIALPSADGDEVKFLAPALVDFGYWLQEFPTSSLSDQVDVMSAIAARPGQAYAVHPWVSFCPWRQLVEPSQMEIVMKAVLEGGFVGVKLYPVMGFRPWSNATASDLDTYPEDLRCIDGWASRLDQALAGLYDWCVAEDVPILAHCSQSQSPSAAAGARGAPQLWREVLLQPRWSSLRLDLAHLGGLWDLAQEPHNDWTEQVVDLLACYPNVYSDLADYTSIMERPGAGDAGEDRVILPVVEGFLDKPRHALARQKLMYGTDWIMLSIAVDVGTYYSSMRDRMSAALQIDPQALVGGNAARFLGLAKSGGAKPKTRVRLEGFYERHGLDPSSLARWDS
jgi:predicted TIM-barrel fold metal-dependent hydrolase